MPSTRQARLNGAARILLIFFAGSASAEAFRFRDISSKSSRQDFFSAAVAVAPGVAMRNVQPFCACENHPGGFAGGLPHSPTSKLGYLAPEPYEIEQIFSENFTPRRSKFLRENQNSGSGADTLGSGPRRPRGKYPPPC